MFKWKNVGCYDVLWDTEVFSSVLPDKKYWQTLADSRFLKK